MVKSLYSMRWILVLALVLGPAGLPAVAFAQEGTTSEAGTTAVDPAAEEADTAAAGAAGEAEGDIFDQAALPTASDEELGGIYKLPALGFLLDMFVKGGNFMWPLAIALVLGIAVILERFYTLTRAKVNTRQLMGEVIGKLKEGGTGAGVQEAVEVCQRTRGPIAAILHAGLMRASKGPEAVEKAIESAGTIEMSFLQRGLIVLASIANVAPLLGFLGTVSGMINAFEAIAAAEQVSAKLVATGISEALITTATGLMVAIPIQLANNFFISRIDRFVLEMEEASVELVDTLVDMEAHRA